MGPLIPQGLINADLSLFFAFVIGLGFGYVLEQGGFSNSRKLAGVFYGYDFVVLRVFFTAAITAALGLILLQYMGWIEHGLIYINPSFLWSIIVGGAIMGVGFILGGFCPGTSFVAAIIGKIDAMFFVIGLLVGVFIFGSFYETFQPLYTGSFLGNILVYDSLGMSREVFVLVLVIIALTAFIITRKIEDSINGIAHDPHFLFHPSYRTPFLLMLGTAMLIVFLPAAPRAKWYQKDSQTLLKTVAAGEHYTDADELAFKLLNPKSNDLLLVDVMKEPDRSGFRFPEAIRIPFSDLLNPSYKKLLKESDKKIILYSYSSSLSDQAWLLLSREGVQNLFVLKGGLNGFFETYFTDKPHATPKDEMQQFRDRFIEEAHTAFKTGQAAEKAIIKKSPVTTIVEIEAPPAGQGGC